MLDLYYTLEGPLPIDVQEICKKVRVRSAKHVGIVKALLKDFFRQELDGYHKTRCDIEIQKYREKAAKASQSASARWGKPASERNANASRNDMRTHSEGNANQNQEPVTKNQEPIRAEARASRLPQDWILPTSWCEWAEQEKGWSTEAARSVADGFRDYWIAKAGKDGRKLDWEATWRNWCRNQRGSEAPTFGKTSQAIALLEQMKG